MNQFELSTLILISFLLMAVMVYSYVQIANAQKRLKQRKNAQYRAVSDAESLIHSPLNHARGFVQPDFDSAMSPSSRVDQIDLTAQAPMFGTAKSTYHHPTAAGGGSSESADILNKQFQQSIQANLDSEPLSYAKAANGFSAASGVTYSESIPDQRRFNPAQSRETHEPKIQLKAFQPPPFAMLDYPDSRTEPVRMSLDSGLATLKSALAPQSGPSIEGRTKEFLQSADHSAGPEQHSADAAQAAGANVGSSAASDSVVKAQSAVVRADSELYRQEPSSSSALTESRLGGMRPLLTSVESDSGRDDHAPSQCTRSEAANGVAIQSMQDLQERATWSVFSPWGRLENWLTSAFPQGVDRVDGIDGLIDIVMTQPKVTQDIEQALYELRLHTELPLCLFGSRAGRVSFDSSKPPQRQRTWEQLEKGAPYSALRLSLQLANRTHCVNQSLLQAWFDLAEKLRNRLGGHIEFLPDVLELAEYGRYLHGIARRLGQPLVLQLHKPNGLWPAYEIHQQLSACGAVLNQQGMYVVRESAPTLGWESQTDHWPRNSSNISASEPPRSALYTVVNDINNPRAEDFFREQIPIMHVHTLSFCLDFARVEARLNPLQRMCEDMQHIATALDAQWQNAAGDTILPSVLSTHSNARALAFERLLSTIGLDAGSPMTQRLLLP